MTPKEELKNLVSQMNTEQFQWFIYQMRRMVSGESAESIAASYGVTLPGGTAE